ncbi:tyrosine-type recombinase/integrase [Seonamhaeicola marinus]|uniref:Tyrosine-type recombinase/integrase n=1 Tax=Seonamhaeicola marinus TaxID=1912246 RepID=A0A5D0HVU7_9FLAO|nr:tyrosine-type recombinase/integrase [Seonamhaeicola marinus]TYA74960.1 tyrosine-type recombinase/integrase [Seonamhaeicola marinus]
MATIKIVLRKNKQRKDGRIPIALRIIQGNSTRYKFLGQYILEKDWDADARKAKKSHPNSGRLNSLLLKELKEANDVILDAETTNRTMSTAQIKNKVKRSNKQVSFFQFGAERLKQKYLSEVYSVAKAEKSILYNIWEFVHLDESQPKETIIEAIKKRRKERVRNARKSGHSFMEEIKLFSKDNNLYFEDINDRFINRFKTFCRAYLGQEKTRTITNQLIFVRTLFNNAMKEGIVDSKYYPFAGDKEKIRLSSGNKIGLDKEEVEAIENLKLSKGKSIWHAKNVWLFAYYFAGIRISDVLEMKWSDFVGDRLFYEMNKNEKPVSLKIPDKAKKILAMYKKNKTTASDFVFPFLKDADTNNPYDVFVKTRNGTSLLNTQLKKIAEKCDIEKNLSNHIARHTFGNIAGDKISPIMLQKLYRHSDLKTTINYQTNFIHKDADDALDAVLNS